MQMPQSHDRLPAALLQVGGRQDTPAYLLKDLHPGHEVPGPAILIDDISTVVVEPLCRASITANRDIRLDVRSEQKSKKDLLTECDPIQLAIFSHRSAPVAGQACACRCRDSCHQAALQSQTDEWSAKSHRSRGRGASPALDC